MTERQKEYYNLGLDHAAHLHEVCANRYDIIGLTNDAAVHRQWAQNIRAEYKPTRVEEEQ